MAGALAVLRGVQGGAVTQSASSRRSITVPNARPSPAVTVIGGAPQKVTRDGRADAKHRRTRLRPRPESENQQRFVRLAGGPLRVVDARLVRAPWMFPGQVRCYCDQHTRCNEAAQ